MGNAKKPKKWSKSAIAALPVPASGRAEYRDSGAPGLYVVVHHTGKRSWMLSKRLPLPLSQKYRRQMLRTSLGDATVIEPEKARKKAMEILSDLDGFLSGKLTPPDEKQVLTLQALHDRAAVTLWAGRTKAVKAHSNSLNNNCPDWLHKPLDQITPAVFRERFGKIGATRKVTANRWRSLMLTLFQLAQTDFDHPSNPALVTKPFPEESRERRLSKQEMTTFLKTVESHPMRDLFLVALFTGARKSNVTNARWQELDLAAGEWAIPGDKMKAGQSVRLPLAAFVVDLLRARKASASQSPWVFPGKSADQPVKDIRKQWDKACKQAELEDFHFHDLRRSLASFMADTGASDALIGKALGHSSTARGVVGVYARADLEAVRQAVEKAVQAMLACRNDTAG